MKDSLRASFLNLHGKTDESGQALVEFAICLPVLIAILCAILDFGWLYLNEYEVNHATYEAARYASMHMSDEGMNASALVGNMNTIVRNNLSHCSGDLSVTVNGLYTSIFPTITVNNPIQMFTFVGYSLFGRTHTISVTNTFGAVE